MLRDRARAMRKQPSRAEHTIWQIVRNRQPGAKFRRQFTIDHFIADFAAVETKLVIEVDGPSHDDREQALYDEERTARLNALGWRVLRLKDNFILSDQNAAIEMIREALKQ